MEQWNGFKVLAAEEPQEESSKDSLVHSLQVTLSDVTIFYYMSHSSHWNVKGTDFAQYHALFEAIYSDVYESIDAIAENILKLGYSAPISLKSLVEMANITEVVTTETEPIILARNLKEKNTRVIETLKKTFDIANKENEQGVANFIAERIDMHQKWDWQLKASLGER